MIGRARPSRRSALEVTIVTRRWDPSGGGCEAYLSDLLLALRRAGHSAAVSCGGAPVEGQRGPVLASYPVEGATHYQLHSGIHAEAYAAERESFDSGLRRLFYWPALRWNRRRSALLRAEERAFSREGPRLMVWSESLRSRLLEHCRVAPERVTACAPGVDLKRFQPVDDRGALRERFGAGRGELLLLFVGHNFVLKGLARVLEALRRAGEAGLACRLLVAGKGHVLPFRRRAARLSIGDRVKFLGAVDRSEMPTLYSAADVLVHPTFSDPFSLVALEALACGCPVITTRANGASRLIESGRQGFLMDDPRDAGGIVRALESLRAAQPGETMRREAVELARRHPFETHAREVIEWLRP